jgi:hypothetical protein
LTAVFFSYIFAACKKSIDAKFYEIQEIWLRKLFFDDGQGENSMLRTFANDRVGITGTGFGKS